MTLFNCSFMSNNPFIPNINKKTFFSEKYYEHNEKKYDYYYTECEKIYHLEIIHILLITLPIVPYLFMLGNCKQITFMKINLNTKINLTILQ